MSLRPPRPPMTLKEAFAEFMEKSPIKPDTAEHALMTASFLAGACVPLVHLREYMTMIDEAPTEERKIKLTGEMMDHQAELYNEMIVAAKIRHL